MTDNPYPVGTTVFAKLKGYPWWPARIENDEDLPLNVSSKKPKQRPIWPVFFFGSYDYGWFGSSELKSFDPVSAEKTKSSLKRGSGLRTALSEALDPSLIAHRTSAELDLGEYDDEDQDEQKQAGSKRKAQPKTKKSSPKSDQAPAEKRRRSSTNEDQSARRKVVRRTTDSQLSEDENTSKLKKRSTLTRSHLESDLRSVDDDISIGDASNGHTRRSEDDPTDSGDPTRAKKRIRSGQPSERLLKLRHKLQKLLLVEGLTDEVLAQNLDRADPIMTEVEAFEIDLQMLKDTKIGRLMKKISVLQCSRDQHKIIERSIKLIKQYKSMMEKAQENGAIVSVSMDKTNEASSPVVETSSATIVVASTTTTTTTTSAVATVTAVPTSTTEVQAPVVGTDSEVSSEQVVTVSETTEKVTTELTAPTPTSVPAPEAVAAVVETNTLPAAPSTASTEAQAENGSSIVEGAVV
ncbi:hypothetical protein B0O80DRAFT_236286 [Mortierella sp. GBAus27b]|nr:hypothetical protein BGX31_004553 [Mortierella sp. GBA43]KAI8359726.1 hypothetical protein B0O80DRAFT_236286 [Mortierella sp. GBAus27b]